MPFSNVRTISVEQFCRNPVVCGGFWVECSAFHPNKERFAFFADTNSHKCAHLRVGMPYAQQLP